MTVYQQTSDQPKRTAAGYATYRAGVQVSAATCDWLAGRLAAHHQRIGTPWRVLSPLTQAVLTIAFLRSNLTYAELAAGYGISPATCWRNIHEGLHVLADRGRRLSLRDVARLAKAMGWDYVIVDGTHIPTLTFGRHTGLQRHFYSGKHKRHGLNVQTVCSPDGDLLWASAGRPGKIHDLAAARAAGIGAAFTVLGIFADLGYLGRKEAVTPFRRRPRRELTAAQRAANRLQAELRCRGERGNAQLKYWRCLATELRCRPSRCTMMIKAVLALHHLECDPFAALAAA